MLSFEAMISTQAPTIHLPPQKVMNSVYIRTQSVSEKKANKDA